MAKKTKKKQNKLYNLLMVIKQNKILFTIYSMAVFIILIIMDYWAGFFKLSLILTPFVDNNTQYLHFLPFINLNLNPVAINFNRHASIASLTWGGAVIYCFSMILTSLVIGLLLTWLTIKLEKKFSSKKKPFILVFIPFFALSLSVAGLSAKINNNNISWIPEKITQSVFTGTSKILNAQFIVNEDLENINLEITPGLKIFLTIIPSSFQKIEKDKVTEIKILVSIPADTEVGDYGGTIHIKSTDKSKRTYPQTLKANLSVEEPTADYIPNDVSYPAIDKIYNDQESGVSYVNDEILVSFSNDINEATIKQIVADIGGVFLGSIQEMNLYRIRINNANELESKINELNNKSEVSMADYHWIFESF